MTIVLDTLTRGELARFWQVVLGEAQGSDVDFSPRRIETPPLVALTALMHRVERGDYDDDRD